MRHKPEEISELEPSYFALQAYWGVAKHMGGISATRELIESCHIDEDKYVLDVGCGIGITPCFIAKRYGCRVVEVDISEEMIDRSNERAKREGVEDRVEFRIADAQNLPFQDALFDVVMGESVTPFPEDKQRTLNEYVRVKRPGGYVGLNEATWLKTQPLAELVEYVSPTMEGAEFLTSDGWVGLLESAGWRDIVVRTYKPNRLSEYIDGLRRFGLRDLLGAWWRVLSLYIKSSAFRRVIRENYLYRVSIRTFLEYLGYAICVGRK